MAHINADRVKETTTTTGTGAITLAGAVVGFRSFLAAPMATNDTCDYSIVSATGVDWETGIGTFTSPSTLARTIFKSSSTGSPIAFAAGTKEVFNGPIAKTKIPWNPVASTLDISIDALNDVAITSPTSGQVLKHNGTQWVNGTGGGTVQSVALSGGTTGLTVTGSPITGSGTITLTGTLAVANGGTGQVTAQASMNALAGGVTSAQYLRGTGTNVVMSAIQAADVPTLNQSTTGTAATVTGASQPSITTAANLVSVGTLTTGVWNATTIAVANGGTGVTTSTGTGDNVLSNSPTLVTPFSNSLAAVAVTGTSAGNSLTISAGSASTAGAGGNFTITAGNGAGVGAGGNLILAGGVQGSSGGDGVIKVASVLVQNGTTFKIKNTTNDVPAVTVTPRISFITNRSGSDEEAYFSQGRLFLPAITNIPSLTIGHPGGPEAGNSLRNGIGNVIDNDGIGMFSNNFITLWCYQARANVINGLGFGIFAGATSVATTTDIAIDRSGVGILKIYNRTDDTGGSLSFPSATTNVAASVNDLALGASAFQRINATHVLSAITGIAPPSGGTHVDGREIRIFNTGSMALTLTHNSTSSAIANRMFMSGGADLVVAVNGRADFIYDSNGNGNSSSTAGWRVR